MTLHPLGLRGRLCNLGDQTPRQPGAPGSGSLQAPLNEPFCLPAERVARCHPKEPGAQRPAAVIVGLQ